MKKRKILITGAEGALGKLLLKKLIADSNDCLGLIRRKAKDSMKNKIKCDVTNYNKIKSIIFKFKPNIIIHLAGLTGNLECEKEPKKAFATNLLGTLNILKSSTKLKPKIIFSSSREVYGNTRYRAKESSLLRPININGATKMLSEYLIIYYNQQFKIPYVILRFTNFFSENFDKRGISAMLNSAIKGEKITIFGGHQNIDLLHYDEAVSAVMKAIKKKKSEIFNIGSGKSFELLAIIGLLEKAYGKKIRYEIKPYRNFEVRNFQMDTSKAKNELNFKSSLTVNDVLRKMVSKWSPN